MHHPKASPTTLHHHTLISDCSESLTNAPNPPCHITTPHVPKTPPLTCPATLAYLLSYVFSINTTQLPSPVSPPFFNTTLHFWPNLFLPSYCSEPPRTIQLLFFFQCFSASSINPNLS